MSGLRILAVAIAITTAIAAVARAEDGKRQLLECVAPPETTHLSTTLSRVARRLARHEGLTIVAIGSSSTEGFGASTPQATYPSRLEAELRARFPGVRITMLNRGVGGEDADEMLARMDRDVRDQNPDLVLWQVGTNAVLSYDGIARHAPVIHEGLKRLIKTGADIVLIDPQYAPKVLRDPDTGPMLALIEAIAKEEGVPVFHRYELMRYWHENRTIPFETFLSPDLLHMNDWSYGCWAKMLAAAIAQTLPPMKGEAGAVASANGGAPIKPDNPSR
jgi:lysophospholipase L1-like esterase